MMHHKKKAVELAEGAYRRMADATRAHIMASGKQPYDKNLFEGAFLGELGQLLNHEHSLDILQSTRSSHHRAELLCFRRREYIKIEETRCSKFLRRIANTDVFKSYSIGLIMLQTVLVGMQMDQQHQNKVIINILDRGVVIAFCAECLFIMLGHGKKWWLYFSGIRVGKWETPAKWNSFDFLVSFTSLLMWNTSGGGAVSVLRVLRVVRILKQFLSHAPGFIVIMQGLKKGLDSVFYISCLMMFVLFLYGIIGLSLFGKNDPVHFGTLGTAMVTLYQCATLSNWHNVLYLQMYGCQDYDMGLYKPAEILTSFNTDYGWFFNFECVSPEAKPLSAIAFFVTFTTISSFIVLSLFVGTITLGMLEATHMLEDIVDMQDAHTTHRRRFSHTWLSNDYHYEPQPGRRKNVFMYDEYTPGEGIPAESTQNEADFEEKSTQPGLVLVGDNHLDEAFLRRMSRGIMSQGVGSLSTGSSRSSFASPKKKAVRAADLAGIAKDLEVTPEDEFLSFDEDEAERRKHLTCFKSWPRWLLRFYLRLSKSCNNISKSRYFEVGVMFLVLLTAVLIGAETIYQGNRLIQMTEDLIIFFLFGEVFVKILAEGTAPQRYFKSGWNTFDFTVTIISVVSLLQFDGFNVSLFRLLRLLQLLRTFSKIEQLRIIIESLVRSVHPIKYALLIIGVFDYLSAILGMSMFRESDPFHFGNLSSALLTIYRIMTLQSWEKIMNINVRGCDKSNYAEYTTNSEYMKSECLHPHGYGWAAVFYFVCVTVVGSILLPTLLVALITACTESATRVVRDELSTLKVMESEASSYPEFYTPLRMRLIRELFHYIDVDGSGHLSFDEIGPLMGVVDDIFTLKPYVAKQIFMLVDADSSGVIEINEFMHLFRNLAQVVRKVQEKANKSIALQQRYDLDEMKEESPGKKRKPPKINKSWSSRLGMPSTPSFSPAKSLSFSRSFKKESFLTPEKGILETAELPMEVRDLAAIQGHALAGQLRIGKQPRPSSETNFSFGSIAQHAMHNREALELPPSSGEALMAQSRNYLSSAMARLVMSDPSATVRLLTSQTSLSSSSSSGDAPSFKYKVPSSQEVAKLESLMAEAASEVAQPLLLHRSSTLDANLAASAETVHALRVLDKQDLGRVVALKGAAQRVDRLRWTKGRLLNPENVEAVAAKAKHALERSEARLAQLSFLAEDEARTGYHSVSAANKASRCDDVFDVEGVLVQRPWRRAVDDKGNPDRPLEGDAAARVTKLLSEMAGFKKAAKMKQEAGGGGSGVTGYFSSSEEVLEYLSQRFISVDLVQRVWWSQPNVAATSTSVGVEAAYTSSSSLPTPFSDLMMRRGHNNGAALTSTSVVGGDPKKKDADTAALEQSEMGLEQQPSSWSSSSAPPVEHMFGHEGTSVFALRAGWCVLAGEQQVRRFRRDSVAEAGSAARRKVAQCLVEWGHMASVAKADAAAAAQQQLKEGGQGVEFASERWSSSIDRNSTSLSLMAAAASPSWPSDNATAHLLPSYLEIASVGTVFKALMTAKGTSKDYDRRTSSSSKQQRRDSFVVGGRRQPSALSAAAAAAAAAGVEGGTEAADVLVERETFEWNLRRILREAAAKRKERRRWRREQKVAKRVEKEQAARNEVAKRALKGNLKGQGSAVAAAFANIDDGDGNEKKGREAEDGDESEEDEDDDDDEEGEDIGFTAAEIDAVMLSLDANSDGFVSLQEFEAFVNCADDLMEQMLNVTSKFSQTPYGMPDLRTAFLKASDHSNGDRTALKASEFRKAVKSLGCDLTRFEVSRVMAVADVNRNGAISYDEFERAFLKTDQLCARLRSALENLAVHGTTAAAASSSRGHNSAGGGGHGAFEGAGGGSSNNSSTSSGVRLFHLVMNSLPRCEDPTGYLAKLALQRSAVGGGSRLTDMKQRLAEQRAREANDTKLALSSKPLDRLEVAKRKAAAAAATATANETINNRTFPSSASASSSSSSSPSWSSVSAVYLELEVSEEEVAGGDNGNGNGNLSFEDVHVPWKSLRDALLHRLPLGLAASEVDKVLVLTDATGEGHCSVRQFERLALGLSPLLLKLRAAFQTRCAVLAGEAATAATTTARQQQQQQQQQGEQPGYQQQQQQRTSVCPLKAMLRAATWTDEKGNVRHSELATNSALLSPLLPPLHLAAAASTPSAATLNSSLPPPPGGRTRTFAAATPSPPPSPPLPLAAAAAPVQSLTLTHGEAARLLYCADAHSNGLVNLPLLVYLVTDVSDLTAKVAAARTLRRFRGSLDADQPKAHALAVHAAAHAAATASAAALVATRVGEGALPATATTATNVVDDGTRASFADSAAAAAEAPSRLPLHLPLRVAWKGDKSAYSAYWAATTNAVLSAVNKKAGVSAQVDAELRRLSHLDLRHFRKTLPMGEDGDDLGGDDNVADAAANTGGVGDYDGGGGGGLEEGGEEELEEDRVKRREAEKAKDGELERRRSELWARPRSFLTDFLMLRASVAKAQKSQAFSAATSAGAATSSPFRESGGTVETRQQQEQTQQHRNQLQEQQRQGEEEQEGCRGGRLESVKQSPSSEHSSKHSSEHQPTGGSSSSSSSMSSHSIIQASLLRYEQHRPLSSQPSPSSRHAKLSAVAMRQQQRNRAASTKPEQQDADLIAAATMNSRREGLRKEGDTRTGGHGNEGTRDSEGSDDDEGESNSEEDEFVQEEEERGEQTPKHTATSTAAAVMKHAHKQSPSSSASPLFALLSGPEAAECMQELAASFAVELESGPHSPAVGCRIPFQLLPSVVSHLLLCYRGHARALREEHTDVDALVFGEGRLEASGVLKCAQFGGELKVSKKPKSKKDKGKGGAAAGGGSAPVASSMSFNLFGGVTDTERPEKEEEEGDDDGGEWRLFGGSPRKLVQTALSPPPPTTPAHLDTAWQPVVDLEPAVPLFLSATEMRRLSAHLAQLGTARAMAEAEAKLGKATTRGDAAGAASAGAKEQRAEGGRGGLQAKEEEEDEEKEEEEEECFVSGAGLALWAESVHSLTQRLCSQVEAKVALQTSKHQQRQQHLARTRHLHNHDCEDCAEVDEDEDDDSNEDEEGGDNEGVYTRKAREKEAEALKEAERFEVEWKRREARRLGQDAASLKASTKGQAHGSGGTVQRALKCYSDKLGVELVTEHGATYFMMGELYCSTQQWAFACKAFERAVEFSPELSHEYEVLEARDKLEQHRAEVRRRAARLGKGVGGRVSGRSRGLFGRSSSTPASLSSSSASSGDGKSAGGATFRRMSSSLVFFDRVGGVFRDPLKQNLGQSSTGSQSGGMGSSSSGGQENQDAESRFGTRRESRKAKIKADGEKATRKMMCDSRSVWQLKFNATTGVLGSEMHRQQQRQQKRRAQRQQQQEQQRQQALGEEGEQGVGDEEEKELPSFAAVVAAATDDANGGVGTANNDSANAAAYAATDNADGEEEEWGDVVPTLEQSLCGGSLVITPPGNVKLNVLNPNADKEGADGGGDEEESPRPGLVSSMSSASLSLTTLKSSDERTAKGTLVGLPVPSDTFLAVSKASRYLGDNGTKVEFELLFTASSTLTSTNNAAAVSADPSWGGLDPGLNGNVRRIKFSAYVEQGAPRVMSGVVLLEASQDTADAAAEAATAAAYYSQAIALSHLGDATFSPASFHVKGGRSSLVLGGGGGDGHGGGCGGGEASSSSSASLLEGGVRRHSRGGQVKSLNESWTVSVRLLCGKDLVCKEALHKLVLSRGKALGDPYVRVELCGDPNTACVSSTKYKTLSPVWGKPESEAEAEMNKKAQQKKTGKMRKKKVKGSGGELEEDGSSSEEEEKGREGKAARSGSRSSSEEEEAAVSCGEQVMFECALPMGFREDPFLRLFVFDEDLRSAHDPMGQIEVPLESLLLNGNGMDGSSGGGGGGGVVVTAPPTAKWHQVVNCEGCDNASGAIKAVVTLSSSPSLSPSSPSSPSAQSHRQDRFGSANSNVDNGSTDLPPPTQVSERTVDPRLLFGHATEVLVEKGKAYVKLGHFTASRAESVFSDDDRHGVRRMSSKVGSQQALNKHQSELSRQDTSREPPRVNFTEMGSGGGDDKAGLKRQQQQNDAGEEVKSHRLVENANGEQGGQESIGLEGFAGGGQRQTEKEGESGGDSARNSSSENDKKHAGGQEAAAAVAEAAAAEAAVAALGASLSKELSIGSGGGGGGSSLAKEEGAGGVEKVESGVPPEVAKEKTSKLGLVVVSLLEAVATRVDHSTAGVDSDFSAQHQRVVLNAALEALLLRHLPSDVSEFVQGTEFEEGCALKFEALVNATEQSSGEGGQVDHRQELLPKLDSVLPVLDAISEGQGLGALSEGLGLVGGDLSDLGLVGQFLGAFDYHGDGALHQSAFVDLNRFFFMVACLEDDDGEDDEDDVGGGGSDSYEGGIGVLNGSEGDHGDETNEEGEAELYRDLTSEAAMTARIEQRRLVDPRHLPSPSKLGHPDDDDGGGDSEVEATKVRQLDSVIALALDAHGFDLFDLFGRDGAALEGNFSGAGSVGGRGGNGFGADEGHLEGEEQGSLGQFGGGGGEASAAWVTAPFAQSVARGATSNLQPSQHGLSAAVGEEFGSRRHRQRSGKVDEQRFDGGQGENSYNSAPAYTADTKGVPTTQFVQGGHGQQYDDSQGGADEVTENLQGSQRRLSVRWADALEGNSISYSHPDSAFRPQQKRQQR